MADQCPNSAKPGGEAGGIEWTAVHESERCNRLPVKRLSPELQRHQPLVKTLGSEFESLPPSQPNSLLLRHLRLSGLGNSAPMPRWCPRWPQIAATVRFCGVQGEHLNRNLGGLPTVVPAPMESRVESLPLRAAIWLAVFSFRIGVAAGGDPMSSESHHVVGRLSRSVC